MGEYEIFVGGQNDVFNGTMKSTRNRYRAENPDRTATYVRHNQDRALHAELKRGMQSGEPINVICHSRGCNTAMREIEHTGISVATLVTLDPVAEGSRSHSVGWTGDKPPNVDNWVNVDASRATSDLSNIVANVGDTYSGDFPTQGSDTSHVVDADHDQTTLRTV